MERVLSEKQQREMEEQQRLEEARKAAEKSDNKRERALMDMMGGVLEVKKEDMLKQVSFHKPMLNFFMVLQAVKHNPLNLSIYYPNRREIACLILFFSDVDWAYVESFEHNWGLRNDRHIFFIIFQNFLFVRLRNTDRICRSTNSVKVFETVFVLILRIYRCLISLKKNPKKTGRMKRRRK